MCTMASPEISSVHAGREKEKGRKLSSVSSYKYINPIIRGLTLMASSKPSYLPKTASLNTITLGITASTYEF